MTTLDASLQTLVDKFPHLKPSIRTWNLMHRSGFTTAADVMLISEEEVRGWRNHNEHTWLDIQVLQDALRKMRLGGDPKEHIREALRTAEASRRDAEREVLVTVVEARANGMLWREIGDALGLEKTTVIMRYAKRVKSLVDLGEVHISVSMEDS